MRRIEVAALRRRPAKGLVIGTGYLILGLADMSLSLIAFTCGISEANPFMAWLLSHGLFVPGKMMLTAVAAGLIAWTYRQRLGRALAWATVIAMLAVNLYHLWGLGALWRFA